MEPFEHFPQDEICPMCGTNEDKKCVLIPIDGTSDGSICEAIPVHAECARKGDLRFNRGANVFYKVGIPYNKKEEHENCQETKDSPDMQAQAHLDKQKGSAALS